MYNMMECFFFYKNSKTVKQNTITTKKLKIISLKNYFSQSTDLNNIASINIEGQML